MSSSDSLDVGRAGLLVLVGTAFGMFSSFLFRLVGARYLTSNEFGIVMLGLSFIYIVSIPCVLGLEQGIVKYISSSESEDNINDLITFGMIMSFLAGVLIVIVGHIFLDPIQTNVFNLQEEDHIVSIFIFVVPIFAVYKVMLGTLRGRMNSRGYVVVSKIVEPLTLLSYTLIVVLTTGQVVHVAVAIISSFATSHLAAVYYVRKSGWRPRLNNLYSGKQLLLFSLPLMISASVYMSLSYADKILIGYYINSSSVAKYEVAFATATLLQLFNQSLSFLLYPKISALVSEGNKNEIINLYQQTTKWILILTTPAFVVLLARPYGIIYLFGESYISDEAITAIGIIAFGLFLHGIVGPNGEALLGYGRSRSVLMYNSIAVGTNIVFNVLLIPMYGIIGAAVASVIGYSLMNLLKSADLYIFYDIPVVDMKTLLTSVAVVVGVTVASSTIRSPLNIYIEYGLSMTIGVVTIAILVALLFATSNIDKEDKQLVHQMFQEIRGKIYARGD